MTTGRLSAPADLAAITGAASRKAGGVPAELLTDYLPAVLDAASTGRRTEGLP